MRQRHRNRLLWAAVGMAAGAFIFASTFAVPADAQKKKVEQKKKAPNEKGEADGSRQSKQAPRVFVPKEKISTGKSVSFPADI